MLMLKELVEKKPFYLFYLIFANLFTYLFIYFSCKDDPSFK